MSGKIYELAFLLSPLVAAEELAATVEREVKAPLAKVGAELKSEIAASLRPLAYPIKKVVEHKGTTFREAYFGILTFAAEPEAVVALAAGLKQSALIIRHIIFLAPPVVPVEPPVARRPRKTEPAPAPVASTATSPSQLHMTTEALDREIDQLLIK